MGRCIGLDVHRDFAQVAAIWENGPVDAGRVIGNVAGAATSSPRRFAARIGWR